jgi:hypothetical protein
MRKISDPKLLPLLNRFINLMVKKYLSRHGIDSVEKINISVNVRKSNKTPFEGYNAGSRGEPYDYILEIVNDVPIPYRFGGNQKLSIRHLESEIKSMLPLLDIDTSSLGNVIGVFFSNVIN